MAVEKSSRNQPFGHSQKPAGMHGGGAGREAYRERRIRVTRCDFGQELAQITEDGDVVRGIVQVSKVEDFHRALGVEALYFIRRCFRLRSGPWRIEQNDAVERLRFKQGKNRQDPGAFGLPSLCGRRTDRISSWGPGSRLSRSVNSVCGSLFLQDQRCPPAGTIQPSADRPCVYSQVPAPSRQHRNRSRTGCVVKGSEQYGNVVLLKG